jgi:hypothetical protein
MSEGTKVMIRRLPAAGLFLPKEAWKKGKSLNKLHETK